MKHALTALIAIAVALTLGSSSEAALIPIDGLGVAGGWSRGGGASAANSGRLLTGAPCGITRSGSMISDSFSGCAGYVFSSGSSVTIDVTAGAVPIAGGPGGADSLKSIRNSTPVLTIPSGARLDSHPTGALTGRRISMLSPMRTWSTVTKVTRSAANRCSGPSCDRISMTDGMLLPLQPSWADLTDAPPLTEIFLRSWLSSPDDASIQAGPTAVGATSNPDDHGNRRPSGITFARIVLWISAPEALIPALVALGVGSLVLGTRKLGSR